MEISNVRVYDLEESLKASGYAMSLDTESCRADLKRGSKLGSVKTGTGHDNFLCGVRVSFDVKYSQYWSMQAQRYNWFDIVSSQSKMHRILKMNIKEQCNKYVTVEAINNLNICIAIYNEFPNNETFMGVISNVPMGLELIMRVSTNYQQLKTIYFQRKNHKLLDWKEFCLWVETLPYFKEMILS